MDGCVMASIRLSMLQGASDFVLCEASGSAGLRRVGDEDRTSWQINARSALSP